MDSWGFNRLDQRPNTPDEAPPPSSAASQTDIEDRAASPSTHIRQRREAGQAQHADNRSHGSGSSDELEAYGYGVNDDPAQVFEGNPVHTSTQALGITTPSRVPTGVTIITGGHGTLPTGEATSIRSTSVNFASRNYGTITEIEHVSPPESQASSPTETPSTPTGYTYTISNNSPLASDSTVIGPNNTVAPTTDEVSTTTDSVTEPGSDVDPADVPRQRLRRSAGSRNLNSASFMNSPRHVVRVSSSLHTLNEASRRFPPQGWNMDLAATHCPMPDSQPASESGEHEASIQEEVSVEGVGNSNAVTEEPRARTSTIPEHVVDENVNTGRIEIPDDFAREHLSDGLPFQPPPNTPVPGGEDSTVVDPHLDETDPIGRDFTTGSSEFAVAVQIMDDLFQNCGLRDDHLDIICIRGHLDRAIKHFIKAIERAAATAKNDRAEHAVLREATNELRIIRADLENSWNRSQLQGEDLKRDLFVADTLAIRLQRTIDVINIELRAIRRRNEIEIEKLHNVIKAKDQIHAIEKKAIGDGHSAATHAMQQTYEADLKAVKAEKRLQAARIADLEQSSAERRHLINIVIQQRDLLEDVAFGIERD